MQTIVKPGDAAAGDELFYSIRRHIISSSIVLFRGFPPGDVSLTFSIHPASVSIIQRASVDESLLSCRESSMPHAECGDGKKKTRDRFLFFCCCYTRTEWQIDTREKASVGSHQSIWRTISPAASNKVAVE